MMHPYSSRDAGRWIVPMVLGGLSVALAYGTGNLVSRINANLWWFDVPSVLGYYALARGAFDHWGWRLRGLRWLGVRTPDLAGTWIVSLRSSYDGHSDEYTGEAQITQTWSRMHIRLQTAESVSHSVAASMAESDAGTVLYYHYRNEPHSGATESMEAHAGAVELCLSGDGKSLEGGYFSGRGRVNHGRMRLVRKATEAKE